MNIFVIPSWYPNEKSPVAGIFFKEQTTYIAEYCNSNNIALSVWGQSDDNLKWFTKDLFPLGKFFNKALYTISQRKKINVLGKNLIEFYNPVITCSERIFNANFQGIVNANEQNLKAFIKQIKKVDIIHAHVSFPAGYIAKYLSDKYNIPYVITEHMGPFPFIHLLNSDGSIQNKVYEPLKFANKIIAVSPSLCNKIKSFGLPDPIYIPNIIDEDFFGVINKNKSDADFCFFCLGDINPNKGIKDLLLAIPILISTSNKKFLIRIGGTGQYFEEYKILTEELQLTNYVTWLGRLNREEVRNEYHNCDAFVLSSHLETFGVVYAEALACGKPVIGTFSGGPESIVNDLNGVLAKVGDSSDLASKMLYVMKNINQYNSLEIRKDFEIRFSKKAVVPKIFEIYNKVLGS